MSHDFRIPGGYNPVKVNYEHESPDRHERLRLEKALKEAKMENRYLKGFMKGVKLGINAKW